MSSPLELYVSAFDSSVIANAGILPTDISDSVGSYDAVFNLNFPYDFMKQVFQFTKKGDDITITCLPIDLGYLVDPANGVDVPNAIFHSLGTSGSPVYFSSSTNPAPDSAPVLTDDYLGYIAKYELGSQYLVGAFDNVSQIISSITNKPVLGNIYGATQPLTYDISDYLTNNGTDIGAMNDSALWVVYSAVLQKHPERIAGSTDGVISPLLQAGDVIQVKFTVHTPDLDASIVPNAPQIDSALPNPSFTPSRPADRVYMLRFFLVK
jgi:hypothetical protein